MARPPTGGAAGARGASGEASSSGPVPPRMTARAGGGLPGPKGARAARKMKILVPSLRDLKTIPPTINALNCFAARGEDVTVFSYHSSPASFRQEVRLINLSASSYPKAFLARLMAKAGFYLRFILHFLKTGRQVDLIWLGAWDVVGLTWLLRLSGSRARIVYQFHELEMEKLSLCRRADWCIVPDENRLWITYFLGRLRRKPFLLPNIPFVEDMPEGEAPALMRELKSRGMKVLLYQGLVDFRKRCLEEILQALVGVDESVHLVVMPSSTSAQAELARVLSRAGELGIGQRVHVIPGVPAPAHLHAVQAADIGIGLYRAISLNQVYAAPNRLYEFTRFGIPAVLPAFPYFNGLAARYPLGITVAEPEDVGSIRRALNSLARDEGLSQGRENARRFFAEHGHFEEMAMAILGRIREGLGHGPQGDG